MINEDALVVKNGFIYKMKFEEYGNASFIVKKKNEKSIVVNNRDTTSLIKFRDDKNGLVNFKFSGTKHWRSLGKDIQVEIIL